MGLTAKLKHGSATLDLHDITNFRVQEFNPPPTGLRQPFSYTLPLDVVGTTPTMIDAQLMKLQNFLDLCWKDPAERSFLMLRGEAALSYEPIWGQRGASPHYQILAGRVIKPDRYGTSERVSGSLRDAVLELELAPPIGIEQMLGLSTGGVLPFRPGKSAPHTTGMIIPRATTNEFRNPVFGELVLGDWDDSVVSTAYAVRNTNPDYIFAGQNSLYIFATPAAAVDHEFTIDANIPAGDTSISAMVKMPDGSAVDSTIVRPQINATSYSDAEYVPVGNGWYWMHKTVTTSVDTSGAHFEVQAGKGVFIDAIQIEAKDSATFPCHGELLGSAWDGTAQGSSSTRTVGALKIRSTRLNKLQGTICMVWLPLHDYDSARYASTVEFFDDAVGTGFRGVYRGATDDFLFSDGTSSADSGTQTFTAGTPIVLHFTWGGSGLAVYKNGSSIASNASFTVPTFGNYLFIGSNSTPANHCEGIFLGFTIYDRQMTAAEALAHYTEIAPLAAARQRVDWMPSIWVKDGDNIADNCLDSTRENYVVAIDIPGQLDCEVDLDATFSVNIDSSNAGAVLLSRLAMEDYVDPAWMRGDLSGTVDAGSSGGEYDTETVDTTAVSFSRGIDMNARIMRALADQAIHVVARMKDAGANLQIKFFYNFATDGSYGPDFKPITLSTSFLMRMTGQYIFKNMTHLLDDNYFPPSSTGITFQAIRGVSGSAAVDVDFYQVLARPILKLFADSTALSNSIKYRSYDERVMNYVSASSYFAGDKIYAEGDRLEFMPDHYNLLINVIGSDTGSPGAVSTSYLIYYNEIKVRPRWLTI